MPKYHKKSSSTYCRLKPLPVKSIQEAITPRNEYLPLRIGRHDSKRPVYVFERVRQRISPILLYFDQRDQCHWGTEAVGVSYFDFLVRGISRYETVTGLQRAMERAANTDAILPGSAARPPDQRDYAGKHKALEDGTQ